MTRAILIRGGTLVDGAGGAPLESDVEVVDGKIARVGSIPVGTHEIIDARDCIVTPDRKSTRLNSSHVVTSRMPSSA